MGRNSAESVAARTEEVRMPCATSPNSSMFISSRTRVLVVLAPLMPSLKPAVIWLLRLRTWRYASRIPFWNFQEITARGGSTSITTRASCQFSRNICTEQATRYTAPQHRSSSDQPMVSARRWVSLVMRDIR